MGQWDRARALGPWDRAHGTGTMGPGPWEQDLGTGTLGPGQSLKPFITQDFQNGPGPMGPFEGPLKEYTGNM